MVLTTTTFVEETSSFEVSPMDSVDNHSTSSSSDVDAKIARRESKEEKVLRPLDDGAVYEANSQNDIRYLPSCKANGTLHLSPQINQNQHLPHLQSITANGECIPSEFTKSAPPVASSTSQFQEDDTKDSDIVEDTAWRDILSSRKERRFSSKANVRSYISSNSKVSDGDLVGTWPRRKFSSDGIFSSAMFPLSIGKHMAGPTNGALVETSLGHSPLAGSKSDIFMAWEEDNFGLLSTQLSNLDKKIQSMTESQMQVDTHNLALQRENSMLRERVAFMEDQVREEEVKAKQQIFVEKQESSEKMTRLMRAHQQEVDELREKYHQLEMDNAKIRLEITKLKSEADKFSFEKIRFEEKLEENQEKINLMQAEMDRYREFTKRKLEDLKKDRDMALKTIDEMHEELSELREKVKAVSPENHSSGADGKDDLMIRYREVQDLVRRLTLENRDLLEQLEESKAELFTKSVNEGRKLLLNGHTHLGQLSWQVALEECSQQELLFFLTKERETTNHLRDYIDRMLSRIMEENPTLLERSS